MQVNDPTLAHTLASLTAGETDEVALMATLAREANHADTRFDWTGFHHVTGPEPLMTVRQGRSRMPHSSGHSRHLRARGGGRAP